MPNRRPPIVGLFLRRHRFARKCGFVDLQVDGFDQASVRRNPVAGPQLDHVARRRAPAPESRLPAHRAIPGQRRRQTPQCLDRPVGPVFLHESQEHGKQHDDGNRDGFDGVPQKCGQQSGHQENNDQDVLELLQEKIPGRDALNCLQFVRTIDRQSPRRFRHAQAR